MGSEYKSFGKLMINSLYGRLGMNEIETYSLFIENKKLEYYQKKFNVISHVEVNDFCLINMEINNELRKIYKLKTKTKNNISLASAITSKARIKLYNAQQEVIKNKGRILYSDTDSIFASYDRNVLNEKHGEIF
jgi:DNA polymerase elongation subunit (family B)